MSDIFHTLTYASTIRNSVTGPLDLSFEQFKTTQKAGILRNISNRFGPAIVNTSKFLARDAFYSTNMADAKF